MKILNNVLQRRFAVIIIALTAVCSSCTGAVVSTQPSGATNQAAAVSPAQVEVKVNRADIDFPNRIIFYFDASSVLPVNGLSIEYSTDKKTIMHETTRAEPKYITGSQVSTSWVLEMKKAGSIPPGTNISWQWKVADAGGRVYATPPKTLLYSDSRYDWKPKPVKTIDIYWSGQNERMVDNMIVGLEAKLDTVKLPADFAANRKPKIYLYSSIEDLKGAMLFPPDWIGAVAYYDYNIILIPCSLELLSWCSGALAHELTHLIVREYIFGPYDQIPTWLSEGLSEYSEGDPSDYEKQILRSAVRENKYISVRSLNGSFPAGGDNARLAYLESGSIVRYLISTGGWEKLRKLLDVYKDGNTNNGALLKVYGVDTAGLEKQWIEWAKQ